MDILNEKIEGLVKKAEKSGMPYGILKKVYDRGMAAWRTGHRPGTTPQQWAFARVNSFVTKSSGTWGGADKDLAKQVKGESTEVPRTKSAKEMIGQVKEGIKPYVSMMKKNVNGRRKLHYRVLDKDEKEIFVTLDKKKADDFLKKNMSKLKSGTIKPIEEKLPKDADAGDYVKDFRKSKAPQFKGKSDKKIQKMAIAAYLDSKEEKDLDEENLQELINFDRQLKDPKKETMVMFTRGNYKGRGFVIDKKDLPKFERQGAVQIESNDIQESGHTDVPSMKTQVQIAMDALQKMNTELGKLSDEDELPTWWINKVATAVNKLDGMADYIDAKHDQGQKMNESNNELNEAKYTIRFDIKFMSPFHFPTRGKLNQSFADHVADELKKNGIVAKVKPGKPNTMELEFDTNVPKAKMIKTIEKRPPQGLGYGNLDYSGPVRMFDENDITEERVFVVRFEKEGMRFAVPFSDMKRAKDGEKILKKSAGVSNVSITKDILKPGVSMSKFRTRQEGKVFPESKMGAFVLEMQIDANEMSERDFIKKYQGTMGMSAQELKRMYKEFNEEVHPMVKAAALATSVWAERRHIDPADIDVKATAADRKAADKNIIIQLRRAQDMEKQTGRADQSGIEFLDKKKQKVDPKIVNKALDMFDRMKPNEKQKMQQAIGKSYRDLLKTVQRGRV